MRFLVFRMLIPHNTTTTRQVRVQGSSKPPSHHRRPLSSIRHVTLRAVLYGHTPSSALATSGSRMGHRIPADLGWCVWTRKQQRQRHSAAPLRDHAARSKLKRRRRRDALAWVRRFLHVASHPRVGFRPGTDREM